MLGISHIHSNCAYHCLRLSASRRAWASLPIRHQKCARHRRQAPQAMRAVVQRVKSASVTVEGKLVSSIGSGLLCLIGLADGDADQDAEFIARKLLNCRLWPSEDGLKSWDQSVTQKEYELLLVSQFTLCGMLKGNKPDFHLAMPPQMAKAAYEAFVQRVRLAYRQERVQDGVFAAMMDVELVNDGPVTMVFDSKTGGR